jgi:hypothetical protein
MLDIPNKVADISSLYVNAETGKLLNPVKGELNFKQLCRPDLNWIYNKCMKKSYKHKEIQEENYKSFYKINPVYKTNEATVEYLKKHTFNSYDNKNYFDNRTENQLFLSCSQVYYQQCREFYEKRR